MQDQKYDLNDINDEDTAAFMQDFQELLLKHSVYFEPIPVFVQNPETMQWSTACNIKLLKKTLKMETVEVATAPEAPVPADPSAPVPSPFTPDEPTVPAN